MGAKGKQSIEEVLKEQGQYAVRSIFWLLVLVKV